MKLRNILFLSFILATSSTAVFSSNTGYNVRTSSTFSIESVDDDIVSHTVAKGETIYAIAAAYHTTVQQIYTLNPKAEKGIKVGDRLLVPKLKIVSAYTNHLIEPRETLYSLSRVYNMSIDDIKGANSGLDENTFSVGKIIKIPLFATPDLTSASNGVVDKYTNTVYKIQKGETLYSISKTYNTSVEALYSANPSLRQDGLKEGMTITIPKASVSEIAVGIKQDVVKKLESPYAAKGETVRIGILLPFSEGAGVIQKDKLIEYYEGFLLSVKELKEKGLNADIYVFDTGNGDDVAKLESLLGASEMQNLHLILGGVSKQQVDAISKFSKKTGIKYVAPFGTGTDAESNPNLFQMTTSHSSLYSVVTRSFVKRFKDYTVIFVSESGSDNNKSDFVSDLQAQLSKNGILYKTVLNSDNLSNDVKEQLNLSGKNILVPTSSSESTLRKITAITGLQSTTSISLFGYPEWQVYANRINKLHKFDSYIFSIFFLDDQQKEVQDFSNQFKIWYNRPLINSFPKWAYLGYDTGLYFLSALNQYGSSFESGIQTMKTPTLQSSIYFEQLAGKKGGYINNGLYFIHYKTDSSVEKIDVSR